MRTHGAVVGRRFRSVTKLTTKVRIGRVYLWGSFLIAAAALKTPTRNGYNAQGGNLNFCDRTGSRTSDVLTGRLGTEPLILKVSCDEWYWKSIAYISVYMCGIDCSQHLDSPLTLAFRPLSSGLFASLENASSPPPPRHTPSPPSHTPSPPLWPPSLSPPVNYPPGSSLIWSMSRP